MITNTASGTNVHEIAPGIYRINTPVDIPGGPSFNFNQYLIADAEPLVFHTGPRRTYPLVAEAIGKVLPLETIRYVAFSHVEADECGALNDFLAAAPGAVPVCGQIAAMVSVNDLADRPARALERRGGGDADTLGVDEQAAALPPLGVALDFLFFRLVGFRLLGSRAGDGWKNPQHHRDDDQQRAAGLPHGLSSPLADRTDRALWRSRPDIGRPWASALRNCSLRAGSPHFIPHCAASARSQQSISSLAQLSHSRFSVMMHCVKVPSDPGRQDRSRSFAAAMQSL